MFSIWVVAGPYEKGGRDIFLAIVVFFGNYVQVFGSYFYQEGTSRTLHN